MYRVLPVTGAITAICVNSPLAKVSTVLGSIGIPAAAVATAAEDPKFKKIVCEPEFIILSVPRVLPMLGTKSTWLVAVTAMLEVAPIGVNGFVILSRLAFYASL